MTRLELEMWCEKFIKDMESNAAPMRDLAINALEHDWDEEQLTQETIKILKSGIFKDYKHYRVLLADFISDMARSA